MKTTRGLIALAAVLAIAGCSGDVTAPAPGATAPSQSAAEAPATTTSTTTTPEVAPEEPVDENGSWGSGCCSSNR